MVRLVRSTVGTQDLVPSSLQLDYIKPDTPINVYARFCQFIAKSKFSLISPVAD